MKISKEKLRYLVEQEVRETLINDDCSGNVWFDKDGRWTSQDKATSWSRRNKKCKESGQYKVVGGKKTKDNEKCGRLDRKALCKEDENNIQRLYDRQRLEDLLRKVIRVELDAIQSEKGGCTWQQILRGMNQIDLARTGDLGKKK